METTALDEKVSSATSLIPGFPIDLTASLLAFRHAYLQCVAECWSDKAYADKIISGPIEQGKATKCKNLLASEDFKKYLPKVMKTSYPLNWRINLYLIEKIKNSEGHQNLAEYAPYNPESLNGWLAGNDLFVIKIPKAPQAKDCASALAAYYTLFTNIFGNGYDSSDSIRVNTDGIPNTDFFGTRVYPDYNNYAEAITQNIPNNLGNGGEDTFYSFGAVVMNLISVCWKNPDYLEYITSKDTIITSFGSKGSSINDQFITFQNPWGFNIHFAKADTYWENGKWNELENNEVFLQFPSKPDIGNNIEAEPRALARYNGTGPAYPLTCF